MSAFFLPILLLHYISRDKAFELRKKYNKDPFPIQHALTVEAEFPKTDE